MGDKLQSRYHGPFVIAEILGRGVYRLQKEDGTDVKQTANATNLKAWIEPVSPSSSPSKQCTSPKSSPSAKIPRQSPKTSRSPSPSKQHSTSPVIVSSHDTSPVSPAWWIEELNLTVADRSILSSGDWLNDKIIDAVNILTAAHLQTAQCQTSLLAQSTDGFQPVTRGMQVLYDWNHWVAVACYEGNILVANSLGDAAVSPLVTKQLKQLFQQQVNANGEMQVHIVRCAQQSNASDCGVFAAAFLFEWAGNSLSSNLDVRYDVQQMRRHLVSCLERREVLPFPRLRPQRNIKHKVVTRSTRVVTI